MEALMYGWMDRAKMVAFENAPPLITSSRPRMVLCCWAKYAFSRAMLTSGTGMALPRR